MKPVNFIAGLLKLMFLAFLIGALAHVNPVIPFAVLVVLSCIVPVPENAAYGIILETWAKYIMGRFWKDNQFLKAAYDDSSYVLQGRIVHVPQMGGKPAVTKNRAVFPATAVRRTDTEVLYSLDEYTTDPSHIPNIDSIHLSYSKQDSILGDHMSVLSELVADDMLVKWAANATVVYTTGGSGAATVPAVTGQTGTRLGFHHTDLQKLMIKMNVDNIPKDGERYVLIDDNMFDYFYTSLSDTSAKDFSRFNDAANGVIGRLHGFNIMTRSSVLQASAGGAIAALGAALGATDKLASFAWHKNSIAFAMGDKQLFQDTNNPLYYGDIYSVLLMGGGRVRRGDGKGVYAILQG